MLYVIGTYNDVGVSHTPSLDTENYNSLGQHGQPQSEYTVLQLRPESQGGTAGNGSTDSDYLEIIPE